MRVCIFLDQFRFGGAERTLVRIANGLVGRGCEVDFLTRSLGHGAYLDTLDERITLRTLGKVSELQLLAILFRSRIIGIEGFIQLSRKLSMVTRATPKLAAYLKERKPDVLLTSLPNNNITALWARYLADESTRIVIREANLVSRHFHSPSSLPPRLMSEWYKRADAIISVTDGVGDDLSATLSIPRDRIQTIFNPIDLGDIVEQAAFPPEHPWLLHKTDPVLISIGRMTEQKGFSNLLSAFTQASRKRSMRMLIIGHGKLRSDLEKEADRLGIRKQVDFLGHVANPYPLIANSDLLVLSSLWEGLPNVLIEALACATPVVATDCEGRGAREILLDGKLGQLVPPSEPEALAAAIVNALGKDRQSSNETFLALTRFEQDQILDKYFEALSAHTSNAELP